MSNVKLLFYKQVYDCLRKKDRYQRKLKEFQGHSSSKNDNKADTPPPPTNLNDSPLASTSTPTHKLINSKNFHKSKIYDAIIHFVCGWN